MQVEIAVTGGISTDGVAILQGLAGCFRVLGLWILTKRPSSSYLGVGLWLSSSVAAPTLSKSRVMGTLRTVLVKFSRFCEK